MSNEMIDKVASAIHSQSGIMIPFHSLREDNLLKAELRMRARLAIRAIRELPDSIKKAEGVYCNCYTCGGYEEGWQKIIDKILEA